MPAFLQGAELLSSLLHLDVQGRCSTEAEAWPFSSLAQYLAVARQHARAASGMCDSTGTGSDTTMQAAQRAMGCVSTIVSSAQSEIEPNSPNQRPLLLDRSPFIQPLVHARGDRQAAGSGWSMRRSSFAPWCCSCR
jgi:hypothetical protein